ncbi:MAG: disulfide bond formation protein B, partial [Ilumatobacteraceae bacterium]|nr:disulfide bond formation protein B [Ilumatobacteraceae bacterium]
MSFVVATVSSKMPEMNKTLPPMTMAARYTRYKASNHSVSCTRRWRRAARMSRRAASPVAGGGATAGAVSDTGTILPPHTTKTKRRQTESEMNTETMQLLSALLALFAAGGTLALLVARLSAGRSPSAANFVLAFRPVALPLAFMVAGFAMFASLWFSEAANYNPCKLCWYQRIAMYSLAIVSGVALVKRWRATRRSATGNDVFASQREITPYAIVLASLGSVVSTYHYLLEWNPTWESNVCSLD